MGLAAQHDIETLCSESVIAARISQRLETIGVRRRWSEFQQEIYERFSEYQRLPDNIRQTIRESLPDGSRVLVVSKGDSRLTELGHCKGWHFPQSDDGEYSGFYPADSREAIDDLEKLRAKGAEYLLFPNSAFWWLAQYDELTRHLDARYHKIADNEHCIVYELAPGSASLGQLERQLRRLTDCENKIRNLAAKPFSISLSHVSNGAKSVPSAAHAKQARYQQLVSDIRNIVQSVVPKGAHLLVVSRGDADLLEMPDRVAAHFPQAKSGSYAGHHPADSAAAIAQLEALRQDDDYYLLIPSTAYWSLGYYVEFRRHLENCYERFWNDDRCVIYDLSTRSRRPITENGHTPAKSSLFAKLRGRFSLAPVATNGRSHA